MIKRKRLKLFSIILILFISIGFAYLSTNLFMNGLIGYRGNSWSIYFDNIQVIYDNVGVTDPVISNDKLTVNLNIPFSEPGECYKFSVDVVNNGTIDAMLSEVVKTGINSSNKDYLSYNVNYYDGTELKVNDAIKAGSKTRIVIEFDYKYETTVVAPAGNQNFTLSLNYVQAEDDANYLAPMYGSSGNNIFVVNNAKSNSLSNLRIYGNTSQAQYTGQNLYDYKNVSTSSTNGVTTDEDGWIIFSYDNSAGTSSVYSNFFGPKLDVVVGETYTIVAEVQKASGTGTFYASSGYDINNNVVGQFIDKSYELSDLSQNLGTYIYTSVANETDGSGLRPFVVYEAGESGSLKVRLSVIKGTGITADNFVYEKYVGGVPSPNMNYPQDVFNLTGDSSLKFMGKNLFKGSFSPMVYDYSMPAGATSKITINSYDNNNLNFTFNDNRYIYVISDVIKLKKNTTYTISYNRTNSRTENSRFYIYYVSGNDYSDYDRFYNEEGLVSHTFTTNNTGNVAFAWGGDNTFSGETIDIANIQLEEGNSSTDYEAYKEIVYQISLGSLELNSVSGSTDYIYLRNGNWYINKSTNKVKITGEFIYYSVANHFYSEFIGNYRKKNNVPISTHYIGFDNTNVENLAQFIPMYENSAYDLIGFNNTTLYRRTYIKALSTTNELNNFLNNNDVYLYYVLDNTEDVLIEDTKLINQLNAILSTNLTEGFNTVQYISSVDASISFDYIEG